MVRGGLGRRAKARAAKARAIGLIEAARRAWSAVGRRPPRLRFETFASSGTHRREPFRVRVIDRDIDVNVPVSQSLLDALEGAGGEIMSDCLRGECGVCTVDIVEKHGERDHRDVFLSEVEKEEGRLLCACVSRVFQGSVSIDTGYRGRA